MEKDFCLIAPHLRERFDRSGYWSEMLFNGSASRLVTLFARPVVIPPEAESSNKKPENQPFAAPGKIIPQKRRRQSPSSCILSDLPPRREVARCRLLELPVEILDMTLDLLDLKSAYVLGLTCRCLWALAKPVIRQRFAAFLGTWAGTPVICVGDLNICGGDVPYPQGLLSPEDLDELDEGLEMDELLYNWDIEGTKVPVNLHQIASARYQWTWERDPEHAFINLMHITLKFTLNEPYPADIVEVAHPNPASFYPTSQEWVLRNLTTREFVRPTAVALDESYIHGPFIDLLGFGEVIYSRTCWVITECEEENCQGEWAGHSLDIVPSTYLGNSGRWKDISNEVAEDIESIWKGEFGEDWRNHIRDRDCW